MGGEYFGENLIFFFGSWPPLILAEIALNFLQLLSSFEAVVNQFLIVVGGFSSCKILSRSVAGNAAMNHLMSSLLSVTPLMLFQFLNSSINSLAVLLSMVF